MRPAEMLEGHVLPDGWRVTQRVTKKPNATGGHFSTGYLVEHEDGRLGFLKAMDYLEALQARDTVQALQTLTQAYLFERQICEVCRDRRLSRVAHAIASGSIIPQSNNPAGKVEYLIFERADGDIRAHLDASQMLDLIFLLRTLRHITTGLQQLHSQDIAHQDLKPSNVLVFTDAVGSKVSDLGRAWARSLPAPHDGAAWAGDWTYAPIELFYNHRMPDAELGRLSHDLYLLGSLFFYMFGRTHTNAMLVQHLAPEHHPHEWGGTYEEVLPYIRAAFSESLQSLAPTIPELARADIITLATQLCEPDPRKRGDPAAPLDTRRRFSLERVISKLDRLVYQAQVGI